MEWQREALTGERSSGKRRRGRPSLGSPVRRIRLQLRGSGYKPVRVGGSIWSAADPCVLPVAAIASARAAEDADTGGVIISPHSGEKDAYSRMFA